MNTTRSLRYLSAVILTTVFVATRIPAQPFGQWDFNGSNLTATVGTPLVYADGGGGATELATAFGTTAGFGISNIDGTNAVVMGFPAATNTMGYFIPTPPANGGGKAL